MITVAKRLPVFLAPFFNGWTIVYAKQQDRVNRGNCVPHRPPRAKNALASFKYLVGPTQLLDLTFQVLDPLGFGSGDTLAHASIDLGALDPFVQGLWHTAIWGVMDSITAHSEG